MTRKGKIARLPDEIREELNSRLEDAEDGGIILDWLNALPETRAVLDAQFGGIAISKQNLSEWRLGGFREWQMRRDVLEKASGFMDCAEEINGLAADMLVDNVAALLTAQYAALVADLSGEANLDFEARAKVLHGLCQDIVRLQRSTHQAAAHQHQLERLDEERTERELAAARNQALAPIKAALRKKSLTEIFGGSENAAKLAGLISEVESVTPKQQNADEKPEGQT